jgi:ABC-type Fe3+-hydroxamate transport system substrate-binding protein
VRYFLVSLPARNCSFQMPVETFSDQTGFQVPVFTPPESIISLVPSQTELLYHLGLEAQVTGITRYCVHPTHWKHQKAIVGGTKNFDLETIDALKPDLILANKEENYKEGIEILREKYPVWMSDIFNLADALSMIRSVGAISKRDDLAGRIVNEIEAAFTRLREFRPQKVLYLIWRKPWVGVASHTFIDSMIARLGLQNCLGEYRRYPELTGEMIRTLQPDVILLSSEPFPFREKHIHELRALSPDSRIFLVDGEMFSWYGSRLRDAPGYFNSLPLD